MNGAVSPSDEDTVAGIYDPRSSPTVRNEAFPYARRTPHRALLPSTYQRHGQRSILTT
jgi:hypothetical protein